MDKNKKYLSASRIKTLKECSWKYWCKYELKLPEASNDGSSRGWICHLIFEVLGNPRHRPHFTTIIRKQDTFASEAVYRLVLKHAKRLSVDDQENMEMIRDMILIGLSYDFFGLDIGKPTKAMSEYDFAIEKNDYPIRYNVVGFIDKLFLYRAKKTAKMRDFKSSSKMFKGQEITDNLQDWIYSLVIKNNFPEYSTRINEFPFLRHMNAKGEGIIAMPPIADHALEAFEYELSHYQQVVEDFTLSDAMKNFAADQGYPTDGTFSKKLSCGFADYPFHKKKDGGYRWHCAFKFPFEYYSVIGPDGDIVKSYTEAEFNPDLVPDDHMFVKMKYDGCPKFNP